MMTPRARTSSATVMKMKTTAARRGVEFVSLMESQRRPKLSHPCISAGGRQCQPPCSSDRRRLARGVRKKTLRFAASRGMLWRKGVSGGKSGQANFVETVSEIRRIAFLGDYLPRKCGIATFTSDLLAAVAAEHPQSRCFAVPVNDVEGGYEYPEEVRFEIEEQDLASYRRAADFLNISNIDVVCLQHEFGIFGGPSGSHMLALLRELRMPVVTTLHTILHEPHPEQRRVMQELITRSTRLVAMAERGWRMLQEI